MLYSGRRGIIPLTYTDGMTRRSSCTRAMPGSGQLWVNSCTRKVSGHPTLLHIARSETALLVAVIIAIQITCILLVERLQLCLRGLRDE